MSHSHGLINSTLSDAYQNSSPGEPISKAQELEKALANLFQAQPMTYDIYLRGLEGDFNRPKKDLLDLLKTFNQITVEIRADFHRLEARRENWSRGILPPGPELRITAADRARMAIDFNTSTRREISEAWVFSRLQLMRRQQITSIRSALYIHDHCKKLRKEVDSIESDLRELQALKGQRPEGSISTVRRLTESASKANTTDQVNTRRLHVCECQATSPSNEPNGRA